MQELRVGIQVPGLAFGVRPDFMVCERRGTSALGSRERVARWGEDQDRFIPECLICPAL